MSIELATLTACEASILLSNGEISAQELVSAFLARCERFNPAYNAIIAFREAAIDEAKDIDRRRMAREQLGPMAGIPVVVKDTIDIAGLPTTGGWTALDPRTAPVKLIPRNDAPVVDRLRRAGAIILGKTNVSALCVDATSTTDSWAGPTLNAVSPQFCPGASSAGSATAVAASLALLGLGTETGGSIQNPAAAQSLVGLKPTFGLVPNSGILPIAASTRDVVGPIAKTADDAAMVMDVIANPATDERPSARRFSNALKNFELKGRRVGLYGPGWRNRKLPAETEDLYLQALSEFQTCGISLVADPFCGTPFASLARPIPGLAYDARGEEVALESWNAYLAQFGPDFGISSIRDLVRRLGRDPFGPGEPLAYLVENGLVGGIEGPRHNVTNFGSVRRAYLDLFLTVMAEKKLDVLVFPQSFGPGPEVGQKQHFEETTVSEMNIGGFPAVTVPCGYYRNGFPFSLILIGRPWDDAGILAFAHAFLSRKKSPRQDAAGPD